MRYLKRIEKMLGIALVGSILTVIAGEMPLGWAVYPELSFEGIVAGFATVSDISLFMGALFGTAGIILQHYGFKAIAEVFERADEKKSAAIVRNGAMATGMAGPAVHVLTIALIFISRFGSDTAVIFMTYVLMPVAGLLFAFYVPMLVMMVVTIIQGKTLFKRWTAVFSPAVAGITVTLLFITVRNSPFISALFMASMGIGSLWCFMPLYILIRKKVNI